MAWRDVDDGVATLDPHTLLPAAGALLLPTAAVAASSSVSSSSSSSPASAAAGPAYRLAMTGRAFATLQAAVGAGRLEARTLQRALVNCGVFARMSPEDKGALVEALQALGLYVGMIGDGANDTMALRAAHVGISLSQVEASVAAPFTYAVPEPSIDVIPHVLCEGRGALATSFCLFQFMALYSTIQFANALLIVFAGSFLSNNMYLYQDLFVVLILSLTIGNTAASAALTRKRPSGRLFSAANLLTTFGFIALTFAGQLVGFAFVRAQPWYGDAAHPLRMAVDPEGTNSATPETSAVFLIASLQFVACACIFAQGQPWKLSPLTNRPFCAWLAVCALAGVLLLLAPSDALYGSLSLQRLPPDANGALLALSLASFASYFVALRALRAAREAGLVASLENRFFRGAPKPHRELRKSWLAPPLEAAATPILVRIAAAALKAH